MFVIFKYPQNGIDDSEIRIRHTATAYADKTTRHKAVRHLHVKREREHLYSEAANCDANVKIKFQTTAVTRLTQVNYCK